LRFLSLLRSRGINNLRVLDARNPTLTPFRQIIELYNLGKGRRRPTAASEAQPSHNPMTSNELNSSGSRGVRGGEGEAEGEGEDAGLPPKKPAGKPDETGGVPRNGGKALRSSGQAGATLVAMTVSIGLAVVIGLIGGGWVLGSEIKATPKMPGSRQKPSGRHTTAESPALHVLKG
jgi:hypothetical protein